MIYIDTNVFEFKHNPTGREVMLDTTMDTSLTPTV